MSLVFDKRAELKGQPGLHALVVGVSRYPHLIATELPIHELTTAATSAVTIFRWIVERPERFTVPLATVRVLVSPSPGEAATDPDLETIASRARATFPNFSRAVWDWYRDASSDRQNITFFYCTGHGLSVNDEDMALLLEEYGDDPIEHGVSIDNLYRGMARSVAQTQFYFFDVTRNRFFTHREQLRNVFAIPYGLLDRRIAPKFYANGVSDFRVGKCTLFCEALLRCLGGTAAEPTDDYQNGKRVWRISVSSLSRALEGEYTTFASELAGLDASIPLSGRVRDATVCYVEAPPPRFLAYPKPNSVRRVLGLHAFIIGVSSYPHLPGGTAARTKFDFGMQQLASPALTAYRVCRWLVDNANRLPVPLATVRLLLSASSVELEAEPGLCESGDRATLLNFLTAAAEWQADAAADTRNICLFYFAGHGVQRERSDSVLLLEDFGDHRGGMLRNAVDLHSIFYGMAPSSELSKMAKTQLYFVDACRVEPKKIQMFEWMNTTPVFNVHRHQVDDRQAPIFFATNPGTLAYGIRGEATVFGSALLRILERSVALTTSKKHRLQTITIESLQKNLRNSIRPRGTANPNFMLDGQLGDLDRPLFPSGWESAP